MASYDDYQLPSGAPPQQGPKEDTGGIGRVYSGRRLEDRFEPTGGPANRGVTYSVGSVGKPIPSAVEPGRTTGTGVGVRGKMKFKKGGVVKKASGGKVSSASKRADGCATKGKTKGRFV